MDLEEIACAVSAVEELVLEAASGVQGLPSLACLLLVNGCCDVVLQQVSNVSAMSGFTNESGLIRHVANLHDEIGFVAAPVANFVVAEGLQHRLGGWVDDRNALSAHTDQDLVWEGGVKRLLKREGFSRRKKVIEQEQRLTEAWKYCVPKRWDSRMILLKASTTSSLVIPW